MDYADQMTYSNHPPAYDGYGYNHDNNQFQKQSAETRMYENQQEESTNMDYADQMTYSNHPPAYDGYSYNHDNNQFQKQSAETPRYGGDIVSTPSTNFLGYQNYEDNRNPNQVYSDNAGNGHNAYSKQTSYHDYGNELYQDNQGNSNFPQTYTNQQNNYDDYSSDYNTYKDNISPRRMRGGKSSYHSAHTKKGVRHIPVVLKKKSKNSKKIVGVYKGFYIPNGTQLYGKFVDLKSCKKACELTPTCFSADFNPWVKKCYIHSNLTACKTIKASKHSIHFKKVFCDIVHTPRGLVTLGIQIFKGIKMHTIKDLRSCLKKCVTMGGGIAPKNSATSIGSTPQICFGIDFDFETWSCYLHIRTTSSFTSLCMVENTITTSKQSVAHPTTVNILICPISKN